METIDCAVIGAGVVGLAVARALAQGGREVLVLEAADAIGTETSSRNSEVIHAGIYYPQGSLMARLCVAGKRALYEYCEARRIPFRSCGKLIVATSDEETKMLPAIAARAAANGVGDLRILSADEAISLEPALKCVGALWSPSTGIIDGHAFMLALHGDAEAAGALFAFRCPVLGGSFGDRGMVLEIGGTDPIRLRCALVVNAAGLWAPDIARQIRGLPEVHIPRPHYAKGNYFTLSGSAPFSRLIYPVPVPGGLGTHLTLDMGGNARFGPDVEWVDRIDYAVDPGRAILFYEAVRRYWPDLRDGQLQPGYAGIRPKLAPQGSPAQDFVIEAVRAAGPARLINLFGIESPGLTASLAIGDHVATIAGGP